MERILVVDDRPGIARLAAQMLESIGCTTIVARSGREALQQVNALAPTAYPGLLFSDIVMPGGMNGYMLAQELRRLHPSMPVLLTTGFDRDLGNFGREAPAEFEVLRKPYSMPDLVRRVRMILDGATGPKL